MPKLFFNPLHLLLPPTILALSLPLAVLATLTTTLAILALALRVSIVYFDLALAIIHSWLLSLTYSPLKHQHARSPSGTTRPPSYTPTSTSPPPSGGATPTLTHNRRRSSRSLASLARSDSYTSLLMTTAPMDRDYEGVGGWRASDEDEADTQTWTSLNARLELPTINTPMPSTAAAAAGKGARRHVRSLTGSSSGGFGVKLSPVMARSPVVTKEDSNGSGYFGNVYGSSASWGRRSSVGLAAFGTGDRKRPKSLHGDE